MKRTKGLVLALVLLLALAVSQVGFAAEPQVEFTWLHHFQEEGLQKWCSDAVAAFEAANPNVKITIEIVGADVYQQTLRMKIAAGDAPMLFDLDNNTLLRDFVDAGHVYNVNDMEFYKVVDPALNRECEIDGVTYGATVSQISFNVFYNKTLFDEHGLTAPETREEYMALCDKLLELGITPIAAAFKERWCLMQEFLPYYYNYCWKDNNTFCADIVNGTTKFADSDALKAAYTEFMTVSKYWGNDPFGTSYADACAMVATGEAAMLQNGAWVLSVLETTNPEAEFGVFPIPLAIQEPGEMIFRPGSVQCIYNSPDEAKLDAAKRFMETLFTVESGEIFSKGALQLSSVSGVDFSFNDSLSAIMAYPSFWSISGFKQWNNEYRDVYDNTIMAYVLDGNTDVEALTAELDAAFSSIF